MSIRTRKRMEEIMGIVHEYLITFIIVVTCNTLTIGNHLICLSRDSGILCLQAALIHTHYNK